MAGRGGAGQKGFWAQTQTQDLFLAAEVGRGGSSRQRGKVHRKKDLATPTGQLPPPWGLRAEKGFIAKKILDLDLNPKSFLAAGGRKRGGTARKILGLDLSSKSFLAVEGEQREGSRQKRLCVRGAPPPGQLTLVSSWHKKIWI